MTTYRERCKTPVEAIKFTGDNYKVVETWGTAFGVKIAQFLTSPGVPHVCVEDYPGQPYWLPVPNNHYIAKRPGREPVVMEGQWFEDIYEEYS